jgi:ATP-dependent Lhr-like helicase
VLWEYNIPMSVPASLAWAHPLVGEWFVRKFGTPTEPQEQGWPHILAGRTTLISAPTGSGKTLAAFLACIDRLVRKALSGELHERTEVLYVSPLKALGNDIQKNLEVPLGEILQLAGERGLLMPEIRTAVRTGDTLMPERRAMLKRPPHILVTTPESLYILLTAEKSRAILRSVETVIVDEIHAVADDKRGAHLALSLERLEELVSHQPSAISRQESQNPHPSKTGWDGAPDQMARDPRGSTRIKSGLVRIGLSATTKPIEEVAQFLTGNGRPAPVIVDVGHRRKLDLAIEVPKSPLGPVASNEMWDEIYDRLVELIHQNRSTLVFVNTRRLAERLAHRLAEKIGEENVAAHHGSLSRKLRLTAEKKLKEGQIKALVATASLELGIDIGTVDLVAQINSPRAIAVGLQRVGRSGHWRGAIPKGRFFVTTRDDLTESAALVRAIKHGDLDRLMIPDCPLDILAQQIVAMCAAAEQAGFQASAVSLQENRSCIGPSTTPEDSKSESSDSAQDDNGTGKDAHAFIQSSQSLGGWDEDELFAVVKRAYPYRNLTRETYDAVLQMLAEGISHKRGRSGAYLHWDRINHRLRARRGARLAAITSGGAIPETALFTVVAQPEGTLVGTVDEDFAVESLAGDIMLLGNTSWRIRRVEGKSGRVLVEDAHGAPPNVPFWRGEAPARTQELSAHVGELMQEISERVEGVAPVGEWQSLPEVGETMGWLEGECGLDHSGAEQLIEYVLQGRAVLGAVPTQQTIIAERFFDEGGGMQLVIHAPFGGRVNKAWGLALRKRFCRSFNFELQAAATDNGLNIALAEQHSFPLADVFHFLNAETVQPVLEQAALASPIFGTRWRWDANRALALLRFQGGKKVPPQIQRMRSDDLLATVFPDVAACQENIVGDIQIPDHPLVNEVMKDVLTEAMDLEGLKDLLRLMDDGRVRCVAVDTPVPSQFSHEILNANPYAYLDDAPLEERRARAVEMRRTLPESVLEEVGKLDPAAIKQVREEAWPDVRDADELQDVLHTLVGLPENPHPSKTGLSGAPTDLSERHWESYFQQLVAEGRATVATSGENRYWVAAECAKTFSRIFEGAEFDPMPVEVGQEPASHEDAILAMVTGWMSHMGPATASELGEVLGVPCPEIEQALLRMEATGSVLRGKFAGDAKGETEWCERRLLARIHRLTVATLRKHIEPVTAAQFMNWLLRWQHVEPGTQAQGERGVLEVLRQLQGFEIPASAWERHILRRRVEEYDPKWLDQLCLNGAVGWGRLSPHPVMVHSSQLSAVSGQESQNPHSSNGSLSGAPAPPKSEKQIPRFARNDKDFGGGREFREAAGLIQGSYRDPSTAREDDHALVRQRRVIPTSVAPVTFFLREDADWMAPRHPVEERSALSEAAAQVLEYLEQRGASFFADIVRGTGRLKSEVEEGLWELVAVGLVTADGFDNLRSLIDPKRRSVRGSARPRNNPGRWALLYSDQTVERNRAAEAACWMLLRRYGVVFRDLLARETNVPTWRELQMGFRRLEDRGEIRGGRFVDGFNGEQFALPVAVESLRAHRKLAQSGEAMVVSAADPLNLVGIVVPGERVPGISSRTVEFRDGKAVEAVLEQAAGA